MFFDTHAHLTDESLAANISDVLQAAANNRVDQVLCVGTTIDSSQRGLKLAQECSIESRPQVYASVGIHPNNANQFDGDDWDQIIGLTTQSRVVALGETGLDKHWDDCPWEIQVENLDRHWDLSHSTGLPVILHSRDCELEMLDELKKARVRLGKPLRGVMHSFVGELTTAKACLEMGLYISFAGMITFKKSEAIRAVAAMIPAERLLIETDAPYLTPEPHRGQRPNRPSNVIHTAECIAKTRGCSLSELARTTTQNACRLFAIDPLSR